MQTIQVDDDIYMRNQIYNPLFSCNIDILVGRVYLEMSAPSGYCLKDQQKKVKFDKFQYRQVEAGVLFHKTGHWAEH